MMVGEYDGEIKMDESVGYEYRWVDKSEFLKDVESNPQSYAPWVIEGIKVLKQMGF
jgi:isopentenyldiphosphate isomerase